MGRKLARISGAFARLGYLASLRNSATGQYFEESLAKLVGQKAADRTLCNCHHQAFSEWLGFSLELQKSDLDECLAPLTEPVNVLQYIHLVPPTAREVERQLYLTDLETLLELLNSEYGGTFSIPGA